MFGPLLERVALGLEHAAIPYMVIGGQAVLRHGEARLTQDIDVTLAADLDQLPAVLSAVKAIGLAPLVDPESFTRSTMVLPCQDPVTKIRVDLIFSFSLYEREAIQRAGVVEIGAARVRFASVEDLIIHKVIAGRPRDLEDVRILLVKNPRADLAMIRRVLTEFSDSLSEPLLERFSRAEAEARGPEGID